MEFCEMNGSRPYILSIKSWNEPHLSLKERTVTVIIFLYYLETVEKYMEYIKNIPSWVKIEIYSSRKKVIEKVRQQYHFRQDQNIDFYLKENRGRDISALLVAARKSVIASDYICFIHDKKENAPHLKEETDRWIENLWGNMLETSVYINNVLSLLETEEKLGILFPPDPIGGYLFHWYSDTWLDNYECVCSLADDLQLQVEISREEPPVGLGTVFWAKSEALKKLFERKWQYEDFPEEPVPMDGAINHAVERIFGFVAEDAGYLSGTVMTTEYASWLIAVAQKYARAMFGQLSKREYLFNMNQVLDLDERERRIEEFVSAHKKIVIYGAGNYGKNLYQFLKKRKMQVYAFTVSTGNRTGYEIDGIPVKKINEIHQDKDIGIIIGVSYETRESIEQTLKNCGFSNYIYGY